MNAYAESFGSEPSGQALADRLRRRPVFDETDYDRLHLAAVTIGLLADRLVHDLEALLERQAGWHSVRVLDEHFEAERERIRRAAELFAEDDAA